jgi:hypothetical protein
MKFRIHRRDAETPRIPFVFQAPLRLGGEELVLQNGNYR